jgi:hypothetical protein
MRDRSDQINRVLKQRKILKNNELQKSLMYIGSYQEASNIQTSENTQKELQSIKTIIDDQPKPKSIHLILLVILIQNFYCLNLHPSFLLLLLIVIIKSFLFYFYF